MREARALLVILFIAIATAIVYAITVPQTDSQGIPCTISTAQNADGSRECQ